jgi:hypothetical protein
MRDRAVETALDAWRQAERGLATATPGTPQYVDAATAVEEGRAAYARAAATLYDVIGSLGELSQDDDLNRALDGAAPAT